MLKVLLSEIFVGFCHWFDGVLLDCMSGFADGFCSLFASVFAIIS